MSLGWVYAATVRHVRHEGVRHAFTTPALYVQIDVEAAARARLWSFGFDRPRPVSVSGRDYLGPGSGPLRRRLARWLPGLDDPDNRERIFLLTTPRVLGFAFNPISVFQCVDPRGVPVRALIEVRSTFGEVHLYPVERFDDPGCARLSKEMYVSPFFGVDGEYHVRLSPPGPRLAIGVRLVRGGVAALDAHARGDGRPLTDGAMLWALAHRPASTLLTRMRIGYQAWVLRYGRGLRPRMRPVSRSERTVVKSPARRAR